MADDPQPKRSDAEREPDPATGPDQVDPADPNPLPGGTTPGADPSADTDPEPTPAPDVDEEVAETDQLGGDTSEPAPTPGAHQFTEPVRPINPPTYSTTPPPTRSSVTGWVRGNPLIAAGIAIGAGYLAGRLLSKPFRPKPKPKGLKGKTLAAGAALTAAAKKGADQASESADDLLDRAEVLGEQLARWAEDAGDAVSTGAKGAGAATATGTAALAALLADKAGDLGHRLGDSTSDLAKEVKALSARLGHEASSHGTAWSQLARDNAGDLAHRLGAGGAALGAKAAHELGDFGTATKLRSKQASHSVQGASKAARKAIRKKIAPKPTLWERLTGTARTTLITLLVARLTKLFR